MRRGAIDPVQKRNVLLTISGMLMLMAVVQRPSLLLFFTSASTIFGLAVAIAVAFFMALGIREFAHVFLPGPAEPWYARRGSFIFLTIILWALNTILTVFNRIAFISHPAGSMFGSQDFKFLLMAFEVLWVVLLEWVSYDT